MRNQRRDNFRRQLIGLGVIVALVAVVGAIVFGLIALSNQPRSSGERETDPGSQLANDMERALPAIQVLGVEEDDTVVKVIVYDPEPDAEWDEKRDEQTDQSFFVALGYAADRGRGLRLTVLFPSSTLVGLDGQEVQVLFGSTVFICLDDGVQEVDWASADHEALSENCLTYPGGGYWADAEAIMWPPEQSP